MRHARLRLDALLRRLSCPRARPPWYPDPRLVAGLAIAALAIRAFCALFEDVREALTRWDAVAANWVHGHATPLGMRIAGGLTQLGSSTVTLLIGAAIAPALWRQPVLLVGWVAAFAGGLGLERLFKALIQRGRPPFAAAVLHHASYSFPSGHAMASTIGYLMLAYLIARLAGLRGRRRVWLYTGAGALIGAIGLSRVYLGVHYPSDILAGYVAGAAWVAICLSAIHAIERRQRIRR